MKLTKYEEQTIRRAMKIMENKAPTVGKGFANPTQVKDYLKLWFTGKGHEEFAVVFLSNQNQLIKVETLFRGTIDCASVYPREVVKEALACDSNAVILAHNHPSGSTEPSQADKSITKKLVAALDLLDIRVLDHIIVGGTDTLSFAEQGLI